MTKPSTARIKNFRRKIFDLTEQELKIRAQMKRLYEQLCLDAEDDEMALRHCRQAYYFIQKYRIRKRLEEMFEFHPFFGAHPASSALFGGDLESDDEDDENDGIL